MTDDSGVGSGSGILGTKEDGLRDPTIALGGVEESGEHGALQTGAGPAVEADDDTDQPKMPWSRDWVEIADTDTHAIVISFEGTFEDRLATDPDPSDEKRGKEGWTFADAGEPDLDRVIRFNESKIDRECCKAIRVVVTKTTVDGTSVKDAIIGKRVDLGPNSHFAGEHHSPGLEPIAAFQFHIRNDKGDKDYINGAATDDVTPKGIGVKQYDETELTTMGIDTKTWIKERLDCLKKFDEAPKIYDPDISPNPVKVAHDLYNERKTQIDKHGDFRLQIMTYYSDFPGKVDKDLVLDPMDSEVVKKLSGWGIKTLTFVARFDRYDGDCLAGHVAGNVSATVKIENGVAKPI